MDRKAYSGMVCSQIPNQSIQDVYHHSLRKHGDPQSVWHSDPIGFTRTKLAKNVIQNCNRESGGHLTSDYTTNLGSQLSTSKGCMNQEKRHCRFIHHETCGINSSQQAALYLASSFSPKFMKIPKRNLNEPYSDVDYFTTTHNDSDMSSTNNIYDPGLSTESKCDGFDGIVDSMFVAYDEKMLSLLAKNHTRSDGDWYSNAEPFHGGLSFPCNSSSQYGFDASYENSTQQQNNDHSGELNSSRGFMENNEKAYPMNFVSLFGENLELPNLVVQQDKQRIPEPNDIFPSVIFDSPKSTCDGSPQSQPPIPGSQQLPQWYNQPYSQFGEPFQVQSECYLPEQDKCLNEILQRFRVVEKLHQVSRRPKNDFLKVLCDTDINQPPKRLKMDNSVSSESKISFPVFPSITQPAVPERPPQLWVCDEAPVSGNSDEMKTSSELLATIQDPTSTRVIGNDVADNAKMLDSKTALVLFGELINHTSFSEIKNDVTDDSQGFNFDGVPVISEECIGGCEKEEIKVKTESDQVISEIKGDSVSAATDFESGMKSEEPNVPAVSLTNFFTEEQMKEHMSSLRQCTGQSAAKEVSGDTVAHSTGENTCQLCAVDKLLFSLAPKYCSSCGARIKCNFFYYYGLDEMGTRHCFCTSCFKGSRGGKISFHKVSISKAKLHKERNNEENEEGWVQCDKCKLWQHQICALYNDKRDLEGKEEYICPKCCLEEIKIGQRMPLPKTAGFGAKDLPSCMLSDHIEERLFRRLKEEREVRAKALGKDLDEVPGAADLVVRVVVSVDKQLKVKQQYLDIFQDESYPEEFLYKSKVILLFQKIQGVDVCLFGMYVQEFGSDCGYPNQRCVYISYLDSVKFFKPDTRTVTGEALRTFVYHEILIGYLDYCKKRGFATCYIWACSPVKGEDYILYCHPGNQKTPKSDKLRQWYRSMLNKAVKENIVVDINNLYDHFFVPTGEWNNKITAARLPYFDGDCWSRGAEEIIRNIEHESKVGSQKKVKKLVTKTTLKAMGHTNPSVGSTKDALLMQKLGQNILHVKEDFIMVHLQFTCTHCHEVILSGSRWDCSRCKTFQLCTRCHEVGIILKEGNTHTSSTGERHLIAQRWMNDVPFDTEDKDISLDNRFFENRHAFLSFCEKNHYQFDTLRRAKHSSMMILYHLQNPTTLNVRSTC